MATTTITDASFEADVLQAKTPVLVDFWAEWCAPCKQIGPALEEISAEYADKVVIAKINIDENTQIATKYAVRGIPTLMIFKDGELTSTKIGAMAKSKIVEWLEESI